MGFFSFFTGNTEDKTQKLRDIKTQDTNYIDKEFLNTIVDNSDTIYLYFKKAQGWVGANKKFYKTLGFANIEEFKHKHESIRDLFLNESEEIFTEDDKSWLDYLKKYKTEGYELSILSPDSKVLYFQASVMLPNPQEQLYLLALKDVSDLHYAEYKTEEVERLKTKFLANIGHEFRTPMNGILGFVDLMNQTPLESKQREYLSMINRSSKTLLVNIETLLDLSQMQGGRLSVDYLDFNLLPAMEKILKNFAALGKEKGIKTFAFIDPKLPRELNGDIKKITQIMNALIQNAIKFTPRGGKVIIEVKLVKRQLNGDCSISFSVKDNGNGIAEEQLALMNEPFTASNRADERLGVGLSLSNGLVGLLGSQLRIQSEEGHGSYFNFVLDFKETHGQSYRMMSKRKVKVLLLDQSKIDEANFLTSYLRSFGIDVIKSNILDENVYEDVEALYVVANQGDSSWMFELGSYTKSAKVVLLLNEKQKIQTKLTYIVDEVIHQPLLPSTMAEHLSSMFSLEIEKSKQDKLQVKDKTIALVVEDNLINQRLIQILLQEYNIVVETASNGVEAVAKANKSKYDIVFMDIDMPQKNGIVATKEIKEVLHPNGNTPIVALTAMAMEGDREMLLKAGLDGYISKPLTREKLENVLDEYLKVNV
jgi:signal transduction histidine kinase/CheY-like chemotaxis protein